MIAAVAPKHTNTLSYHDATCSGAFPHEPEHSSTHRTVRAAIAAVPAGVCGYINWGNQRRRVIVNRDGTVSRYAR